MNICYYHGCTLGIVRAIDPEKKLFYVITPLQQADLQSVNVLMKGAVSLPQKLIFTEVYLKYVCFHLFCFSFQSFVL